MGFLTLNERLFKDPFPPVFISRAREFISNESSDMTELCKRLLPYRAQVTFRLATDTVSLTVRTRRLSFFDKLSGFGKIINHTGLPVICCLGGILGLFTGISILSVVEVAFWIIRYLVRKS